MADFFKLLLYISKKRALCCYFFLENFFVWLEGKVVVREGEGFELRAMCLHVDKIILCSL